LNDKQRNGESLICTDSTLKTMNVINKCFNNRLSYRYIQPLKHTIQYNTNGYCIKYTYTALQANKNIYNLC